MRTVVIGTGVGSLASALRLCALGHEIKKPLCFWPAKPFFSAFISFFRVTARSWAFDELFSLAGGQRTYATKVRPCTFWCNLSYHTKIDPQFVQSTKWQRQQIFNIAPRKPLSYLWSVELYEHLDKISSKTSRNKDFPS